MLFRGAVSVRNRAYDRGLLRAEAAPIAVVSVGNLGIGGAGKTPVAAWIAARLVTWGLQPAIVLRGYGADEILVHREINPEIPVFAAARRAEAVREAAASGCDVAVLDDGFQHRAVARQLDIALVAADGWGGNRHLLPRGPWREGMAALRRADLVLVTRKAADDVVTRQIEDAIAARIGRDRIVRCRIAPGELVAVAGNWTGARGEGERANARVPLSALRGRQVLAIASLADPRPFAAHLEAEGAEVELEAFPDHHEFTAAEVARLVARSEGRPLVMTRKEAVKLKPLIEEQVEARMLEQRVVIESGEAALDDALERAVER
jgi:tetraacyldisaccharide 4'-kinase